MLNILIADDHSVVRNGLKMLLESDDRIKVLGEAANGNQALDFLAKNNQVDLVLSDINMPEMDGILLTRTIKERGYTVKVVLLSIHEEESYLYDAFRAGADGYLLKSATIVELIFAIQHVHAGEQYLSSSLMRSQLFSNMERESGVSLSAAFNIELSPRETEVLKLLSKGMTNLQISEKLFLSKRTVEGHRRNLIDKFEVHNTAELVYISMRTGLLC